MKFYLGVKFLGHIVILCLTFLGTKKLSSMEAVPDYNVEQCMRVRSSFSTPLPNLFSFADFSHLTGFEVVSNCEFNLCFPYD